MLTLAQRCRPIELLLLDVDGVLSDGAIIHSDQRSELKNFHVRDGSGIKYWQRAGKQAAILSGRTSLTTNLRAAELGIELVIQGPPDKLPGYQNLLDRLRMRPAQVAFIGDDLPDLPILKECGLAVCVPDGSPDLLPHVHYVTRSPGGRGAVREAVELILRCQGKWLSD
jgi:3-deoxy-D-manno-octulosonate 8-phosphate phosphatase (KDO 8-P phosphatase)